MCPVMVPITGSPSHTCEPDPHTPLELWKFLHISQIINHFFNADWFNVVSDLLESSFTIKISALSVLSKIILRFSGLEEIKMRWRTKVIFFSSCTESPLIVLYPYYPSNQNIKFPWEIICNSLLHITCELRNEHKARVCLHSLPCERTNIW